VSQAVYPRLVQLVHSDRNEDLKKVFHVSCQLMALIILPFALTIAFFSREVIFIWTKDAALTEEVYPLVRILIIGVACNAFVTIPYMLQLAYGWTKLGLYQNIIALFLLIPSLIVVTNIYGATGAAWAWTILNLCYILFSMPVMFRRYLRTEQLNWYLYDIILPIVYASLLMTAGKILLGRFPDASQFFLVMYICLFAMISIVVLTFTSKYLREILYLFLQKRSLR
jgi:O-antigen/teichoic acid export membrane protein